MHTGFVTLSGLGRCDQTPKSLKEEEEKERKESPKKNLQYLNQTRQNYSVFYPTSLVPTSHIDSRPLMCQDLKLINEKERWNHRREVEVKKMDTTSNLERHDQGK